VETIPENLVMPVKYAGKEGETVRAAVFGNEGEVGIRFRLHSEFRPAKSEIMGYDVWEDIEIIEFFTDKLNTIPLMVTNEHRRKYAELYNRFKQGLGSSGTMISAWNQITPSERNMFEAQGIITVEQLAEVSDSKLAALPYGTKEAREKAKKHVAANSGKLEAEKYGETILELQRKLASMEAREAERLEADAAKPAKKAKGRPKKTKTEILENDTESNSAN
jgi:hypothetical protein